jgi:hypothetical protein
MHGLTTSELRTLFEEEIAAAGGSVLDVFDDGRCLFARSLLPDVREVQSGDGVQGGVALRASGAEVWVHPYVFRLVCRNGAVRSHALQTRHIVFEEFALPDEAAGAVRAAVRECLEPEAFADGAQEMRTAREKEADLALDLLPRLAGLPPHTKAFLMRQILERFSSEDDRSRFGLMNAVTSLARDTSDPELRWRLEELGGAIPALRTPRRPTPERAAETVLVG